MSISPQRTDKQIAESARDALVGSVTVPADVELTVEEGWVTLRGAAEWVFQKEAADRQIRGIPGVRGITNLISLDAKVKSEDVKRRIEASLGRVGTADTRNIQVEAVDGRVVLRGTVYSQDEKREAKRLAWLAPGVREVVDELQVA